MLNPPKRIQDRSQFFQMQLQMYLKLSQVAVMLSVSKRTVQRWIKRGEFREVVYVTPTDVRIPASMIAEFIAHRTVRSARSVKGA